MLTDEQILQLQDKEREKVFLEMSEPDKWKTMFSMLAYLRSKVPSIEKSQIEFRIELNDFREELRDVRRTREEREMSMKDTNEKIADALSKRFDFWIWFRDKVLPNILTLIVIALLYLSFGSKP